MIAKAVIAMTILHLFLNQCYAMTSLSPIKRSSLHFWGGKNSFSALHLLKRGEWCLFLVTVISANYTVSVCVCIYVYN